MSMFDDEATGAVLLVDPIAVWAIGPEEVVHERRRHRKKQRLDRKRRERATRWTSAKRGR